MRKTLQTRVAFIGCGPGGSGPIVAATQRGRLTELLDSGICVVDQEECFRSSALRRFDLNSDSTATSFLEASDNLHVQQALALDPQAAARQRLLPLRHQHAPLSLIADYLDWLGDGFRRRVKESNASYLLDRTIATRVSLRQQGGFQIDLHRSGETFSLLSEIAVFGLGAEPYVPATVPIDLHSDQLLSGKSTDWIEHRLESIDHPRVLIHGGSHSAFSAAWYLLNRTRVRWPEGGIVIAARDQPRIFYPDAASAHREQYSYAADDVCPITGRIHRLGGLRGDGREVARRVFGFSDQTEPRVRFVETISADARFDLTIGALGYRPRTLPMVDVNGEAIALQPHVDHNSHLVRADGTPIEQAFGIGLAAGFRPPGERSFQGQTNGVWLYQNEIGDRILHRLLKRRSEIA